MLSHWSVKKVLGLIDDFLGDSLSDQKLASFICEVVAIVFNDVVLFWCVLVCDIEQEVFEDFFWEFGFSHINLFDGFPVRTLFGRATANSTSKKVLLAINDD